MQYERLPAPTLSPGLSEELRPMPSPQELKSQHPLKGGAADIVTASRQEIAAIANGADHRLLVVAGPCSLDDSRQAGGEHSAITFAKQLQEIAGSPTVAEQLFVVMRCPPPKPRTGLGQRGLEQASIERSREILAGIANLGMPLASEVMLARHLEQYGDLLSLAWTGARNGDDVNIRHSLSAYPDLPVWCKNAGSGGFDMATNALETIQAPHKNVEIMMPDGRIGILPKSAGNPRAKGIIYRGGDDAKTPEAYEQRLIELSGIAAVRGLALACDTSHGGSIAHGGIKSAKGQREAHKHVLELMSAERIALRALWIEAYLHEGADASGNTPGMSVTDACVGIDALREMLLQTAQQHVTLQRARGTI